MKTVKYLGKEFEVVKAYRPLGQNIDDRLSNCKYSSIFSAYDKPSEAKISIWKDWQDLVSSDSNAVRFGIVSRNCFMFTLGWITEFHGQVVSCYVTKKHNYMIVD